MTSSVFTRLWSRRWLRVLTWIFFTFVTLWVLLTVVLKWSGQRRWLRLTQELEARGETLDFLKLQPPPIPDEHNFAAIEPLNGIRLGPGDSPEAKAAQAKRDRIEEAMKLFTTLGSKAAAMTPPRGDPFAKALPPSVPAIVGHLNTSKLQLTPQSDAAALRQSIEKQASFIAEVVTAARTLPEVDYLPRWDQIQLPETLFALPVPHCSTTNAFGRLLHLHGIACIESGDAEAAVADVITQLRLAEGHFKESMFIDHLVAIGIHQSAAELTWLLLQKRRLNDEQLQMLQRAFSRLDLPASMLLAMRGEMAAGADMGAYLEKNADGYRLLQAMTANSKPETAQTLLGWLVPSGFFTHAKAGLIESEWDHLVRPLQEQGFKTLLTSLDPTETWLKSINLLKQPDLLLTRMALPAVNKIKISSAFAENARRQALLACALERHFIQHGSYPASLDALEPATLAGATKTAFDESPMHYAVSSDGRYRLWHNGPDGKDDGGSLAIWGSSPRDVNYLGDWTWRYEPVKP